MPVIFSGIPRYNFPNFSFPISITLIIASTVLCYCTYCMNDILFIHRGILNQILFSFLNKMTIISLKFLKPQRQVYAKYKHLFVQRFISKTKITAYIRTHFTPIYHHQLIFILYNLQFNCYIYLSYNRE